MSNEIDQINQSTCDYFAFSCSPPRQYTMQNMEMEEDLMLQSPLPSQPSSPTLFTNTASCLSNCGVGNDIETMIKIKRMLVEEEIIIDKTKKDQMFEYQRIMSSIKRYLMHFCPHDYVVDTFDVDVERSITIEYCTICETIKP